MAQNQFFNDHHFVKKEIAEIFLNMKNSDNSASIALGLMKIGLEGPEISRPLALRLFLSNTLTAEYLCENSFCLL